MNGIDEIENTSELEGKVLTKKNESFIYSPKTHSIDILTNCLEDDIMLLLYHKPSLIYLNTLDNDLVDIIFKIFKINPLIKEQCYEKSCREKDFVMDFNSYFCIMFSDLSDSNDLTKLTQLIIVVLYDYVIVISFGSVHFIDYFFSDLKQKIHNKNVRIQRLSFLRQLCTNNYISNFDKKISLEGSHSVYDILYLIFKCILMRYESLVVKNVIESKVCMNLSIQLSYRESADFNIRLGNAERAAIHLNNLIGSKNKVFKKLETMFEHNKYINAYVKGLKNRVEVLIRMNENSRLILDTAKRLYKTCLEDSKARISSKFSSMFRYYLGLSTIAVPLVFVEGLWSTNIQIPGLQGPDLTDFLIIFSIAISWAVFWVIYLKKIKWF